MNKKGSLEWLKFLFSIGFSGVFALAVVFCLGLNVSKLITLAFLLLAFFSSLFPKAHISSLTIFAIGSFIFLLEKNYPDMVWSIIFCVVVIGIWVVKERENIE